MSEFKQDPASLIDELEQLRSRNKFLEQELCNLNNRYSFYMESAPFGLITLSDYIITYSNKTWRHMFGIKSSTFSGYSPLEFIDARHIPLLLDQIYPLKGNQEICLNFESMGRKYDGSIFPIQIHLTTYRIDQTTLIVAVIQDISAQKEAQRILYASTSRYQAVFNNISVGIAILDSNGFHVEINDRYANYFGYTRQELLTIDPIMLVPSESRGDTQGLLQQLFKNELNYFTMEKRYLRKDGSTFWGHVFASPIPDQDGIIRHVVYLLIDITERKNAENSLAQLNMDLEDLVEERTHDLAEKALALENANRALQKLDDMKTIFLSSVSHELRTPLTSIFGFAKLIHKDFEKHFLNFTNFDHDLREKGMRIKQNLQIIELEGARLSRLVNDVLDLHKIESGHMQWKSKRVSVAECIYEALLSVSGQFSDKPDVKLSSSIPDNLPMVLIDPDRLAQVLINLLHNAAKFTQKGRVHISAYSTNISTIRVQIQDSGPGIPKEDLNRIFEKFQQSLVTDTLGNKPKGTGLGLSISRQILEHFGGRIWAESLLGCGSTFIFELPVAI